MCVFTCRYNQNYRKLGNAAPVKPVVLNGGSHFGHSREDAEEYSQVAYDPDLD